MAMQSDNQIRLYTSTVYPVQFCPEGALSDLTLKT